MLKMIHVVSDQVKVKLIIEVYIYHDLMQKH
jgi:hypothetical protein